MQFRVYFLPCGKSHYCYVRPTVTRQPGLIDRALNRPVLAQISIVANLALGRPTFPALPSMGHNMNSCKTTHDSRQRDSRACVDCLNSPRSSYRAFRIGSTVLSLLSMSRH